MSYFQPVSTLLDQNPRARIGTYRLAAADTAIGKKEVDSPKAEGSTSSRNPGKSMLHFILGAMIPQQIRACGGSLHLLLGPVAPCCS